MSDHDWRRRLLLLQQLYQQGARRIAILGLPPIGCVPSQRTLAGGLARDCDPARNRAARVFNSRLQAAVARLQGELWCQRIGYVDIYDVLRDMIADPCKYGAAKASSRLAWPRLPSRVLAEGLVLWPPVNLIARCSLASQGLTSRREDAAAPGTWRCRSCATS